MSLPKELNTINNTIHVPPIEEFESYCPPRFGGGAITSLDIENIYKQVVLVEGTARAFPLKFKFSKLEDVVKHVVDKLSSIYFTESWMQDEMGMFHFTSQSGKINRHIWSCLNDDFECYGNPFDFSHCIPTETEIEEDNQYEACKMGHTYLSPPERQSLESSKEEKDDSYRRKADGISRDKRNHERKKALSSYVRTMCTMVAPPKLDLGDEMSEKQILRQFPEQRKKALKLLRKASREQTKKLHLLE